jgi:hypothetical protein
LAFSCWLLAIGDLMARKKNKVPSFRVRLDGNIPQPCVDPREQKALDWYKENSKNRMAFPIAWSFIVAAVNGELGAQVQKAVSDGNTAEAIDALQDLLGAFGGDEDYPEADPSPSLVSALPDN